MGEVMEALSSLADACHDLGAYIVAPLLKSSGIETPGVWMNLQWVLLGMTTLIRNRILSLFQFRR